MSGLGKRMLRLDLIKRAFSIPCPLLCPPAVYTLTATVSLDGDESTVGVRSLVHHIARLLTSPAVFCCLFSEAGLPDQCRVPVELPSPGM